MTRRSPAIEAAGHPVVRIVMKSIDHLGQEFFRFEMATAVAGSILGINPFDQPDVEAAKIKTRELTSAYREDRRAAGRRARGQHRRSPTSTPTTPTPRRCARPAPMATSPPG